MTTRATIDLDGAWEFQLDPDARLDPTTLAPDRVITVPGCWQAQFPDLRRYAGIAWYRRSIDVPADWAGADARLIFGAVDYECQVYVNGALAGEHEGGYLPFGLDVGPLLRPGQATAIAVRVLDGVTSRLVLSRWGDETGVDAVEGLDPADIPHGKQSWYCEVSGLWQSVRLERLPPARVERVVAVPDIAGLALHVRVGLAGLDRAATLTVTARAADGSGQTFTAASAVAAGAGEGRLTLRMFGARLWSPESPVLYHVTATLARDGADLDRVTIVTGLRAIETRDGRLYLNGRPLYLRAALDQDFYPDTVYTPPSDDALRAQFVKAKQLGLNSLRLHIKPADPRYLAWADRVGLLIWEEVPSWRTLWPRDRRERWGDLPAPARARARDTLLGMIERDSNHPSVIAYTIVNEDWGTQVMTSASDRAWLAELYAEAKALDPTRLICDNSPCNHGRGPTLHVRTDLDDFHIYYGMPDSYHAFDAFVQALAQRPGWTFSPHGDAQRTGQEPLLLSEFGNWGLPELGALARHWPDGAPPWWVETHAWWNAGGNEISHPGGLAERFARFGLERVWPDVDAFARATQWHAFAALKAEIESIRRRPAIGGYVITEFTDCYWEANGLLDFYRQPKVFHDAFAAVNGPTVLLPAWRRLAYWSGEAVALPVAAAHDGPGDIQAALHWSLAGTDQAGQAAAVELEAGAVTPVGAVTLTAPDQPAAATLRLELGLRAPAGDSPPPGHLDLLIVPAELRRALVPARLALHAPPARAAAWLEEEAAAGGQPRSTGATAAALTRLGYQVVPDPAAADLAVATDVGDDLLAYVRDGGTLLYLPAADAVSPFLALVRRTPPWDGNWISAYHFIKPATCIRRLPLANPLGFAFLNVLPSAVAVGFGDDEHDDLLAGVVVGWCERLAATIGQFRVGRGRVLLCTFMLLPFLGRDPVATVIFHDLIDYVTSPDFAPRKVLPFS